MRATVLPASVTFGDWIAEHFGGVELVKWGAFAAMLVEHWGRARYGDGGIVGTYWHHVGRLAFPLFVFALSVGLAHASLVAPSRVWRRLLVWGVVAQVASLLLREALPFNVLFTLALGLACYELRRWRGWQAWASRAAVLFVAAWCEFGQPGVLFVWAALAFFERPSDRGAGLVVLSLLGVCWIGGSWLALSAVPVFFALMAAPVRLPRVAGVFYLGYVVQFPLIAAVRAVL